MEKSKVLIAAPIGGHKQYSINLWFEWISNQSYENYDICICTNGDGYKELADLVRQVEITDIHGNNKKIITLELVNSEQLTFIQKISYAREKIRRYAVENDYDFILWLDTDTIPANKNAIERLMSWKKDCVSGLYFYKNSKQPVIIDQETNTNISLHKIKEAVENNQLLEVWGFGFGVFLISREAFKDNAFDYDLFGEERTDDFGYCHVLENKGFRRYFDPLVLCKHFHDETNVGLPKEFKFIFPILERKLNKDER